MARQLTPSQCQRLWSAYVKNHNKCLWVPHPQRGVSRRCRASNKTRNAYERRCGEMVW